MNKMLSLALGTTLAFTAAFSSAQADTITVAVAANFTKAIEQIGQEWTKETGNQVRFSFGPTGGLYAQINNGAPFDAFFSADTKTPIEGNTNAPIAGAGASTATTPAPGRTLSWRNG
ncbi:MAG: molybdate ABC transporter substrate-binding protein, partial [Halothiobacillus sp.]